MTVIEDSNKCPDMDSSQSKLTRAMETRAMEWDVATVADWLAMREYPQQVCDAQTCMYCCADTESCFTQLVEACKGHMVDGKALLKLTDEYVSRDLGITTATVRTNLRRDLLALRLTALVSDHVPSLAWNVVTVGFHRTAT